MKIKDTVHLNWYKHVLVLILIVLCFVTSTNATGAEFSKVFSNSQQVSIFLSQSLLQETKTGLQAIHLILFLILTSLMF